MGTGTAATTDLGQEKGGKNVRGLNEVRMLNLMSRPLCRREKISLLPPFGLRKDFGQTKEGMPLGALEADGGGDASIQRWRSSDFHS